MAKYESAVDNELTDSLLKEKKDYFFKHTNNFIGIHILSGKIKDYVMKKLNEDCYDETESITKNIVYNECMEKTRKLEGKIRSNFSDEKNEKFTSYLDLLTDITGEKTCLFYEAMLQTGAYLNKIKEITEAQNEQRIFRNFI